MASESRSKSHWPLSILNSFSSLINMLMPIILVRLISTDMIGLYKVFFLYVMVGPWASVMTGIQIGLYYWVGLKDNRTIIQQAWTLLTLFAVFVLALGLIFLKPISSQLGWSIQITLLFVLYIPLTVIVKFYEDYTIAMGEITKGALFITVFDILRSSFALCAAFMWKSLEPVLIAHISITIIKILYSWAQGYINKSMRFVWNMKANKEIFRYSFPIIIAVILTAISNHADQLILSQLIPYKEFAFYTIGCLIIHPLQILESSVNRVLIPQLANLVSNDKIQEGAFLFKKAISDIAFIIIPATAGLMIFSTPIIVLLFTDKFLPSVMYLQLFALTYLFYINPADALPRASGLGTWILKVKIVSATLSVITVPVMIKLFGPVGALYSLLFLGACYHGYCLWFTKKLSKWRVPEFIPFKMLLTIFISTLIPSILSFIVKPLFNSEMAWFLTCGPIFAVMYFSVMLPIKNSIERRYTWNCNVMSLTKVFSIGGLERMIANLTISVKKLNNFNPSIYIFDHLPNYPNLISELEKSNIPYALSTKPPGFGFKVLFNICKYLYKNNIHIIHTHDLSALIYGTLAKVFTLNKVKVIHTQHSFVHLKAKKSYRTMEKIFTKLADEIVVVSEDLKKTYGEIGVPNKKIHVFENGISFSDTLECFPKERYKNRYSFIDNCTDLHSKKFLKNHEHDIWLIALSRISPGKGQEHMISVWNELDSDIRKKTFFIIVGPLDSSNSEWLSNFHDTLKRAKDRDRILLYGPTNSPATWMKMANVFTSGSEFEGMPLGPIEAACEGCALFLSDIVGHSFFEQKAVHFSLSDFKEAGSKLTQLIETINMNQEIFYERKLLLAKQMRAKYDMDEVAYKYAKLYKKHSSKRLII